MIYIYLFTQIDTNTNQIKKNIDNTWEGEVEANSGLYENTKNIQMLKMCGHKHTDVLPILKHKNFTSVEV